VEASISSQAGKHGIYILGTTQKCSYKKGEITDVIKLPAVSAAVFKIE
jgi:hypothetical protein